MQLMADFATQTSLVKEVYPGFSLKNLVLTEGEFETSAVTSDGRCVRVFAEGRDENRIG